MTRKTSTQFLAMVALVIAACAPCCSAGVDLAEIYPATRTWSQYGLVPIATADDVWSLGSFEVKLGEQFELRGGPATVVFGHDGTDVLWAVVLPDEPYEISGTLAPNGEHARTILLRFAPSEVSRVFPTDAVIGRGDGSRRYEAQRIAQRKMVWRWCTPSGNPTIVPKPITIVDVDTVEGPRRFWMIDRMAQRVERVREFDDQPTPPMRRIDPADAIRAFDEVWSAFDREYAKFVDLQHVDWDALGETYREKAAGVETTFMLAAVLSDMLTHLNDLHIWVRDGDEWLAGYTRERPINANWQATQKRLAEHTQVGTDLVWGRSADDIGYLGVHRLSDPSLPKHVDEALEQLRDAKAMIVDLRFNGGGDELLARAVAGRFASKSVVYSKNQYRSGPKRDELGPVLDRVLEPRGPWRYDKPVVCLFGPRTLSSAESMAAMFDVLPGVTTLGAPTGGSSAIPRQIELDCGIVVNLPRWRDLLVDGTPIEGHGVPPDVHVLSPADAFDAEHDPVMEQAISVLHEKCKAAVLPD